MLTTSADALEIAAQQLAEKGWCASVEHRCRVGTELTGQVFSKINGERPDATPFSNGSMFLGLLVGRLFVVVTKMYIGCARCLVHIPHSGGDDSLKADVDSLEGFTSLPQEVCSASVRQLSDG
eukprot:6487233-Amphidinium_carterae.2